MVAYDLYAEHAYGVQYPLGGLRGGHSMPMGAQDHLDKLYARQRLLTEEAVRLENERDPLDADGADADRHYILEIEIAALRQEASRISARISDVLERDLQR